VSRATHTLGPAREWRVFVHTANVGDIGSVMESSEELARCAALSHHSKEGERGSSKSLCIFEDDEFDVRGAR